MFECLILFPLEYPDWYLPVATEHKLTPCSSSQNVVSDQHQKHLGTCEKYRYSDSTQIISWIRTPVCGAESEPLGKRLPLQYSGLENSMDYVVHGVAKSQIQLNDFHFHLSFTFRVPGGFLNSFHIWYYTCFNAILPNHPTLSLSHRVQKTVLYTSVSFAVSYTGLLLPSF